MKWTEKDNLLERNFCFTNFAEAIAFINEVAEVAENMNHHPDISLYNYNQVRIGTTSHDEEAITQKDYDLAQQIDMLFKSTHT